MATDQRLIDANALIKQFDGYGWGGERDGEIVLDSVADAPTVPAIPIASVSAYLQRKLDEWEALGDRKWEPMNAWGYNFIRACQDDLDAYEEALGK